ncbi:MAG: macro domain-containing protein [Planctomycetes bacterium]|nr:macro domain-containing protein [Planctomycetota bacterium]
MIHELSGDLLLSKADLIAHGTAPNDDWKAGIAAALREQCPAMYKDFRHFCKQQNPKPGTLWLWQGVGPDGRRLRFCALFTQEPASRAGGHGGAAHTEYVNHALHELKKLVQKEGIRSIALPKLGTGKGGLEWQHVQPLIRSQLGGLAVQVLVYAEWQPGVAAVEPLPAAGAS